MRRRRQQPQRLPRAQPRDVRRRHHASHTQAAQRQLLPEDIVERYQRVDRAVVAAVAEMYATGTSTRKVQRVAEKLGISKLSKDTGQRDSEEPRCRRGRAARAGSGRIAHAVSVARRHIREVPPGGRVCFHRGGDRDARLRRGRLAARPRPVGGGHGVVRLVAQFYPALDQGPRRARRAARDLRRP